MKRTLPRELDDLAGMRAARWFRESTAGQWDNFGPDAQREQQDRAIERYALVDAGLEWSVASSGWTSAWRTATWETMISTAQGPGPSTSSSSGYVSRFLRNLKQTLIAVEDHLHTAGVVVLFADERLLSSDPGSWDQFIREAHEAEAYSRKRQQARLRGLRREAPDDSASPAATRCPTASSGRASRRRCGSTRSRPRSSSARTSSPPQARPTGRWQRRPVSPRPTSARSSPTPSTPGDCAPVSPPPSRPSSTRRCGRPSRRGGSAGGPGHRVAS